MGGGRGSRGTCHAAMRQWKMKHAKRTATELERSREGDQEEEVVRVLEQEDRPHVARLTSKSFRIAQIQIQITLAERTNVAEWS
jgi:hypothetical protein